MKRNPDERLDSHFRLNLETEDVTNRRIDWLGGMVSHTTGAYNPLGGTHSMNQYIRRLVVDGLYGRFDIDISFSDGVNIVHGANGTGKTSVLHILTNAANLDLPRFSQLIFKEVRLEIENGASVELRAEVAKRRGFVSQVTLLLDGKDVASWPPLRTQNQDPEDERRASIAERDRISRLRKDRDIQIEATYFPAFRTMIEAWSSVDFTELSQRGAWRRRQSHQRYWGVAREWVPSHQADGIVAQTSMAREVFGEFVPWIDYPSPRDIQRELDDEIQRTVNRLAGVDLSLLSDTFSGVFAAISQEESAEFQDLRTPDAVRANISKQLEQIEAIQTEYGLLDSNTAFDALRSQLIASEHSGNDQDDTTMKVLLVYEEVLGQRVKILKDTFLNVRGYIDAVNDFLDGKQLVTAYGQDVDSIPKLQIRHDDGTLSQLDTLSSGERQIAGLIYSASRIAKGNVILVDEPELSLHIDWQRAIIGSMERQLPQKQLIVCTHSPLIARRYEEGMIELVPKPTTSMLSVQDLGNHEEEWSNMDYSEDDV